MFSNQNWQLWQPRNSVMHPGFKLTRKHYEIIVKQGLDNYPKEIGGFLGGKDNMIQAIQPLFNMHLYNRTDTFSFTPEDVERAHAFFKKHNMTYYGLYHSHPKGVPEPSDTDINTGHKFHFILGLRDQKRPVFNAFIINGKIATQIPFEIVDDAGFSSVDLHTGQKKDGSPGGSGVGQGGGSKSNSKSAVDTSQDYNPTYDEADALQERIDKIVQDEDNTYPKLEPKKPSDSDFSTLA